MNKSLKRLAESLARELLDEIGFDHRTEPAVPLDRIARSLGVSIVLREVDGPLRPDGTLGQPRQLSLFGELEAQIWSKGLRKRYTIAHELAHRIVDTRLKTSEKEKWSDQERKGMLDELAGRLVLPSSLLRALSDRDYPIELSIGWVDQAHRRHKATISCLLKRLRDCETEGVLRVRNCALLAAPGLSAKKRTDYGLRITSSCTPLSWFIPSNRRLSSLGLRSLPSLFWDARVLVPGIAEDGIFVRERNRWEDISITRLFHYIVYPQGEKSRVMLATFDGPDS